MLATTPEYKKMAVYTLPRVEKLARIPVDLITTGEDPYDVKLSLLEDRDYPVLFVDVDAVLLSWDWEPFQPDKFNAVPDYPIVTWGQALAKYFPLDTSINSGVWLANPEHRLVFQYARNLMVKEFANHELKLGDQSALNTALHRLGVPVNLLPKGFNFQIPPYKQRLALKIPNDTHVVHLVGNSVHGKPDPKRKLERVMEVIHANPLN